MKSFTLPLQRENLALLCCIVVTAIVIATLLPFDFSPANEVSWLPDAAGLRFGRHGIVLSKGTLDRGAVDSRDSCSLEIILRPSRSKSLGTFLSLYSADTLSEFKFFGEKNTLEMSRGFLNGLEDSKWRTFRVGNVFEKGKLLFLTITSGTQGITIYKNGGQPQHLSQLRIRAGEVDGQIILGTSAMRFEPYSGEIRGLAIFNGELTPAEVLRDFEMWTSEHSLVPVNSARAVAVYRFDEGEADLSHSSTGFAPGLQIPRRFILPYKPFLESPAEEFSYERGYIVGVAENVLGFLPVGFVFCAYFVSGHHVRRAILYAIAVGSALSLVVEILQFYVPSRGSGITDVIANTTGAALGAFLSRHVHLKLFRA